MGLISLPLVIGENKIRQIEREAISDYLEDVWRTCRNNKTKGVGKFIHIYRAIDGEYEVKMVKLKK